MRLIEPEQITKMMSDLFISKDAVNMTGERQGLWVRFRAIEKAVSEISTIDAVPVVRCKDCKNRGEICSMRYIEMVGEDERIHDYSTDNGYCHWGERKGGDSE